MRSARVELARDCSRQALNLLRLPLRHDRICCRERGNRTHRISLVRAASTPVELFPLSLRSESNALGQPYEDRLPPRVAALVAGRRFEQRSLRYERSGLTSFPARSALGGNRTLTGPFRKRVPSPLGFEREKFERRDLGDLRADQPSYCPPPCSPTTTRLSAKRADSDREAQPASFLSPTEISASALGRSRTFPLAFGGQGRDPHARAIVSRRGVEPL